MKILKWQIGLIVLAMTIIAIILLAQKPIEQIIIAEPTSGGNYVEGLIGVPVRFNPIVDHLNQIDRDVDSLIFSQLIKFDSQGNPTGDLAESFAISISADVINVTLRDNALWHDGTPLTTQDVLFTISLFSNPNLPISSDIAELWSQIEVTAFDGLNIQFILPESYVPFYDFLDFPILPKHIFEDYSADELLNGIENFNPIGSGPYKFESLDIEEAKIIGVTLSVNQEYFLDVGLIEQISFRYFDTFSEVIAAYKEGTISGIGNIPNEEIEEILAEETISVYTANKPELTMILFNHDKLSVPFFQQPAIRKALAYGLNKQWIINERLLSQAVIANGPILPGTWAYNEKIAPIPFNPEEAISMLREAGYVLPGDGGAIRFNEEQRLSFTLSYLETELNTQIVEMIQNYWTEIGVGVKLDPNTDKNEYMTKLKEHQFEAALVDFSLSNSPDPDPYVFWHQAMISGGQNYGQWDDRRASEYLENARVTSYLSERIQLYKNFQTHFSIELPAIPLYFPMYSFAIDASVNGVTVGAMFDPSDRFNQITEWYLVSQPKIEVNQSTEIDGNN
jgi:peptide/nickel transport system substrate-binding protein